MLSSLPPTLVQRLFFLAMRSRRALHEWDSSRPLRWMVLPHPRTLPSLFSFSPCALPPGSCAGRHKFVRKISALFILFSSLSLFFLCRSRDSSVPLQMLMVIVRAQRDQCGVECRVKTVSTRGFLVARLARVGDYRDRCVWKERRDWDSVLCRG